MWVRKKTLPLQPHLEKCFYKKKCCGNSSVGRARPCQGRGRGFESRFPLNILNREFDRIEFFAQVAELVDAHVSGACAARRAGSSPVLGTKVEKQLIL